MSDRLVFRIATILGLVLAGIFLTDGYITDTPDGKAMCVLGGFMLGVMWISWDTVMDRESKGV